MSSPTSRHTLGFRSFRVAGLLAIALVHACVDGPLASTDGRTGPSVLMFAPRLSLRGAVAGTPQADALNAAFNQVDRFRLVIRRQSNNEVVKDTILVVTPGQDSYDLSSPVPSLIPDEQFSVTIIAMQGDVTLFESPPIAVAAVPENSPAGAIQTPKIELEYSGPGATASSVTLTPAAALLGPGGTRVLTASVLSSTGSVVAGVPLSWSAADPTVASVSPAGVVTGGGEGVTRVTVTTPTGLGATGWIYVATGEIAFVQGGHVRTRGASGGSITDASPGASSASSPTYGPGGSPLAWSDGGRVFVGGTGVADGSFPAVSPDGTKLAVERSGRIWFTNLNGTNPTQGPEGTSPAWMPDGTHLAIGGGSVERIKADGTERSTMVAGSAGLPALGSGGLLAYTNSGTLEVQGRGTVLSGIVGRGGWSPSGRLLIASVGSDLVLVDPKGVAPAMALGIGAASDPVWRGAAPSGSSVPLLLTSLQPSPTIPGGEVRLIGHGFDWIIPANNHVYFPSAGGPVSGEITAATETALTSLMPLGTSAGSIRVTAPTGEATLPFAPSVGSIRVRARFAGDQPATDIPVIVRTGAEVMGSANTDELGRATFDLVPGNYTVSLDLPAGYRVFSTNPVPVALGFEVKEALFEVGIVPTRVTLDPSSPTLDAGTTVTVRAHAFDVRGNEITSFRTIRWNGTGRIYAIGSSLDGQLTGRTASDSEGDAEFAITLDDMSFGFGATVRASISGRVTQPPGGGGAAAPVTNANIRLENAAGAVISSINSDYLGGYRFGGLMGGHYTVLVNPEEGLGVSPPSRSVDLGPNATGQDFTLSRSYIEGTITEGGSPSSDVTVRLLTGGSVLITTSTTNGSGHYRFDGLALGSYLVDVTPPSGKAASPTNWSVTLDAEHPAATGQDFTLSGGYTPPPFPGGRPNLLVPVPSNLIVTVNGLDWVYASPCSANGCTAGIAVGKDGFGFASPEQWALRPSVSAFQSSNLCASPYFDYSYDHCDYGDASSGYYGSAPWTGTPLPAPGSNNLASETWLVRVHVPPIVRAGSLRVVPDAPTPAAVEGDPATRVVR